MPPRIRIESQPKHDFLHVQSLEGRSVRPSYRVATGPVFTGHPRVGGGHIISAPRLCRGLYDQEDGVRRVIVLATLVVVGGLSAAVAAYQQPANPPAQRVVEVEKLRDNLFVLRGGGGNTAVFVTTDGVVVVDTKNPGWGQPILDKIKELTNKPVTTIINTHTHGDHVSGNVDFPATVDVVTHENTAPT